MGKFRLPVILTLMICLLSTVATGVASERPHAIAYYASTSPIVDGMIDDQWNMSSPIVINSESQVIRDVKLWGGPDDCSLILYVMWDEINLYIAADVTENTTFGAIDMLPLNGEDNFKLYISTNPKDDPDRTRYSATDFLVYLITDNVYWDTAFDRSMVEDNQRFVSKGMDGGQAVLKGYECSAVMKKTGYTYEAIIPWENFSNENIPLFTPEVGDTVNFNWAITDISYACPGTEYIPQMAWSGDLDIDTTPSLWGTLTFQ